MRFSPFQWSEEPNIQEIQKGLGNGFRNRRGITKSTTFWAFARFPPFRRSQSGNLGNSQGICKWLPQLKRTLQNRQLLGFCEFPSISAVPKAGNPRNPQVALDMVSAKGGLYKIDNFWAFPKFPPFRRSQRPEISPPIELEISAPAACNLLPPCDLPALPTLRTYRHHRPESANDAHTAIASMHISAC